MTSTQNDPFLTHTGRKPPVDQGPWSPLYLASRASILYVTNLTIFSFILEHEGEVDPRWTSIVLTFALSVFFGFPPPSPFQRKMYDWAPLACYLGASVLGLACGQVTHDTLMRPYYTLLMNREYMSVSPSEPAGAHADAGIVSFAPGTRLDATQFSAYTEQSTQMTLCAAPILDDATTSVSFWAVGVECCDGEKFWCGDALDRTTLSGALWTKPFLGRTSTVEFRAVAAKAAATHGIEMAQDSLFLRWVKDPNSLRSGMLRDGIIVYCVFLCAIGVLCVIAYSVKPPKYAGHGDATLTRGRDPFGTRVSGVGVTLV